MALDHDREKLLQLCALHHPDHGRIDWQLLARTAQTTAGLEQWLSGQVPERSTKATKAQRVLTWALADKDAMAAAEDFVAEQLSAAQQRGAELTTVLDEDYPVNLRLVPDAPPFLFYRGVLSSADARAVAVVGTRKASQDGLSRAARMARGISEAGITVVSGLAAGVDTAAHTATVDLGRRTVAVIGAGIVAPIYPAQNAGLAERIVAAGGAVVSQFWPTDPPSQWRFPARNITMSGFSQGTVVVEASSTSGAKMQAQAAYKHAKTVFLLRSLAAAQPWAQKMISDAIAAAVPPDRQLDLLAEQPPDPAELPLRVVEVSDVADVVGRIATADAITAAAAARHRLAEATPGAM
jgi:DNA processing protein